MRKVLVIDDDPSGAQLLVTLLELQGYEALKLENWADPVEDIRQRRPDLIVMDVRLRDKSGFDLLQKIREQPEPGLSHTPVLMMSVEDHRLRSVRAGANGFIAKPFDLAALLAAISSIEEDTVSNN